MVLEEHIKSVLRVYPLQAHLIGEPGGCSLGDEELRGGALVQSLVQRCQMLLRATRMRPRHQRASETFPVRHVHHRRLLVLLVASTRHALSFSVSAARAVPGPAAATLRHFVCAGALLLVAISRCCHAAVVLACATPRRPRRVGGLLGGRLGSVVGKGAAGGGVAVVVQLGGVVVEAGCAAAGPAFGTAVGTLITHSTVGQHVLYQISRGPLRVPLRDI
mmetsp:Transcript_38559/g.86659  ORF Transcript_38559/g.86659 Transcript_38559/m.86659 type:complete len:219 (-) Transcript_38559:416-1072(-)